MQHTEKTIERLALMQYQTFGLSQKIAQGVVACMLIAIGVRDWVQLPILAILCMFIGCWMFSAFKAVPQYRAKKVCQNFHGNYPYTRYEFRKDHFTFYGDSGNESVPYSQLIRLVEDSDYLYLYISKQSAYMIDLRTLEPGSNSTLDNRKSRTTW
jgi:hypothetical protein